MDYCNETRNEDYILQECYIISTLKNIEFYLPYIM
jgi:hypothetical protein